MRAFSFPTLFSALTTCLIAFGSVPAAAGPKAGTTKKPKLVLVLVVDQFRADHIQRFTDQFLPARGKTGVGGFRYLMENGAYFPYGEYDFLQNMTAPGHSTIMTGSYPYLSGISLNYWWNYETKKSMGSVEDPSSPIVGLDEATKKGVSPKNQHGSTLGDELKNAGYPSRSVSVALKDRSSILLAGHRADLAIWHDVKSFRWVTSKYYARDGKLPEWMQKLNRDIHPLVGTQSAWKVSPGPKSGLAAPESVILNEDSKAFYSLGFPHTTQIGSKSSLTAPLGVELTEQAAERALDAYSLGNGKATDVLTVSFSTFDYVGHVYGPNSLEIEEIAVAHDRAIAKLLGHVAKKVSGGLSDVVVVLTADHGMAPNPDWAAANGLDAGRIDEKKVAERVNDRLNDRFGKPDGGDWIVFVSDMNFYLDHDFIRAKKLNQAEIESEAAKVILAQPGVAHVFTSTDYAARRFPPGMFARKVDRSYYSGRNGDIVMIPRPFYMHVDESPVNHLTPYTYDRMVPIILSGAALKPARYASKAEVVDIAPTLAYILGILPPALSEGRVLSEAIR